MWNAIFFKLELMEIVKIGIEECIQRLKFYIHFVWLWHCTERNDWLRIPFCYIFTYFAGYCGHLVIVTAVDLIILTELVTN